MNLRLPSILSAQTLQTALDASGAPESGDLAPLQIDLSEVQFAEFTALAQILLLSEAAARAGRRIGVELPQVPSSHHGADRGGAGKLRLRRLHCLRFLRTTGFTAAISLPHIPAAQVTFSQRNADAVGDAETLTQVDSALWETLPAWGEPETDVRRQHVKRQVLPFRWIAPQVGDELFHSDDIINVIRGLRAIDLQERDAQLLANSLVFELVENVAMHAPGAGDTTPPYALVGALVVDADLRRVLTDLRSEIKGLDDVPAVREGLQLIVGDSGRGLVRTLEPHISTGMTELPAKDGDGGWTAAEAVTLWSLERWSTSTDPADRIRGTRGLWRVRQVVRSYRGSLIIHTRDALAGYAFPDGDLIPLHGRPTWTSPGTLVEANIGWRDSEPEAVVPAVIGDGERLPFRWPSLRQQPMLDWLGEEVGRAVPGPGEPLLITVDGGRTQDITHERLVAFLRAAARLAAGRAVAVLVTGANPVTVDAAVDAIHHPLPDAGPGAPFLLIDSRRRSVWCGGPEPVREVLSRLENEDYSVARTPGLKRVVKSYPHLLRAEAGSARLVLHPAAVIAQLTEDVHARLRDALEGDGPTVLTGVFRTPSLHLADRWFRSDELVEETVGSGVSAFLLAHRLARVLPQPPQPNTRIVQIGPLVRDVATLVAEYVPLRDPVYELPDDLPALRLVTPLAPGTPCVLCCDVVLSTNRTVKVMRQLIASEAWPVAVVAIVDARREPGPITVQGVEIPVLALTRFTFDEIDAGSDDVVDIDPVFRAPGFGKVTATPQDGWSEEEFLARCVDLPNIVGLGHVTRPLNRHFSAYFNAAGVVDTSSKVRDEISDQMLDRILAWSEGTEAGATRMFYVGSSRDYAAKLAGLVAGRLNAADPGRRPRIEPEEIPRAIHGQTYAFPDRLSDPPDGGDVILIDWGSFDATTILQMMRLAAEGGARRVIVLVLLSQMSPHDERALTMMRAVGDPSRPDAVPAEIRFITSLSITPMLPGDCSLCELITDLRTNQKSLNLPYEVAAHADALVATLSPRSRADVIRSGLDAFGSPITTEDAFAFIRLRGRLLTARRDTSEADRLADDLAELRAAGDGLQAAALIRLLAAERRSLAQLPLSLTQCLSEVSRIAREVVAGKQFHERLRLQALVVLAVAAPEDLVRDLVTVWRSALGNPVVLYQILYELWNALTNNLRHSEAARHLLRETVLACGRIEAGDYPAPQLGKEMQRLLERLLTRAEFSSDLRRPRNPMDSWAFLRTRYLTELYRHTEAETAAINLLVLLDSPPTGREVLDDPTWDSAQRLWQEIGSFISTRVLPAMPQLADIMAGAFAQRFFAGRQHLATDLADAAAELRETEALIHALRGEKAEGATFQKHWRELSSRVGWWYDVVLAPGNRAAPAALLARFVDPCPCHLGKVLNDCLAEHPGSTPPVTYCGDGGRDADVEVFCHQDLLRDALHHLLKVRGDRLAAGGNEQTQVKVDIRQAAGSATVHLWLPGPPDPDPDAATMERLRKQLADFGGALEYRDGTAAGGPGLALTLRLWASHFAEDNPA